MSINKKVVIVTGGARGIGLAIVHRFIKEDYAVAILDKDELTLQETMAQWHDKIEVLGVVCDVSDEKLVYESIDKVIAHYGRIDALINNAGIAIFKQAIELTFDEWSMVLATNLNGPFLCTQACIPHMLTVGQAAVVNIASISGVRASTLRIAYGTSKAALMHLTKQQAVEYGDKGIRINAVAPGPVPTDMSVQVHSTDIKKAYMNAIPLARFGTADEIANVVYFLCSEEARYINGQIIAVDGGFDAAGVGLEALRQS